MYEDFEKNAIRRTIVSFDPFLKRPDVIGLTDAQVGKKFGLTTQVVKDMRRHLDVPFDTIQTLCHILECKPADILDATTVYTVPAKNE